MDCPQCGLQTVADQKFCRACGASLRVSTQRLVAPTAMPDPEARNAGPSQEARQSVNGLVLWGFIAMFLGVAIGVIGKKLIYSDPVIVIGVLISLVGMFLTVYPFLTPASRKKKNSSLTAPADLPAQSQPLRSFPQSSNTEYVPSITERTTDLLAEPAARESNQKSKSE